MVEKSLIDLSWDDFDEHRDPRPNENQFDAVVERAVSRRGFLGGALAFGSGAAVFGTGLMSSTTASRAEGHARFAFKPIDIATDHAVHVPEGYTSQVLVRWGDALGPGSRSPIAGVVLVAGQVSAVAVAHAVSCVMTSARRRGFRRFISGSGAAVCAPVSTRLPTPIAGARLHPALVP